MFPPMCQGRDPVKLLGQPPWDAGGAREGPNGGREASLQRGAAVPVPAGYITDCTSATWGCLEVSANSRVMQHKHSVPAPREHLGTVPPPRAPGHLWPLGHSGLVSTDTGWPQEPTKKRSQSQQVGRSSSGRGEAGAATGASGERQAPRPRGRHRRWAGLRLLFQPNEGSVGVRHSSAPSRAASSGALTALGWLLQVTRREPVCFATISQEQLLSSNGGRGLGRTEPASSAAAGSCRGVAVRGHLTAHCWETVMKSAGSPPDPGPRTALGPCTRGPLQRWV